jgi:protein involved in temperature-dependent protein secretion
MVAIRLVTTMSPSAALGALAFALLLLNSGVAARRALARGDTASAAFAAAAAALVAALLAAVRAHEAEGGRRRRLRVVAWALSAALTGMFARRVAGLAPDTAVAALVWAMAGVTTAGGFCCLFVHGPEDGVGGGRDGARPAA